MPTLPPGSGPTDLARAAVAAVLETLAAEGERQMRMFHTTRLRQLAAEVKEEGP